MQDLTEEVSKGGELNSAQITEAATALLDETITPASKADFLSALSDRGETPSEIGAFAEAFLTRAIMPDLDRAAICKPLLDVCGTGGDKLNLFNISTGAVFILAACGVAVVKHGNRGITSKSGGADVLEALGLRIDLPAADFGRCLEEVGAAFLFAPSYHPSFKAVAPARKLLGDAGRRSIFNLLGPLLNPACPDYQLIGVFDPMIGPVFARILPQLGRENAWVVHGTTETGIGMDELSSLGPSRIWAASLTDPLESRIDPATLNLTPATALELQGGDAAANAEILKAILDGSLKGPKREIVALNAAAGLVITKIASDLPTGLSLANEALDSGAALAVLTRWQNFV